MVKTLLSRSLKTGIFLEMKYSIKFVFILFFFQLLFSQSDERDYSEEVASEIDKEVRRYIDKAYAETVELMEANVDKLHLIAKALIERETLDGDELKELMETGAIAPKPEKVEATDIPAPIKPPVGEVENDNTPVIKTAKETLKSLDEVDGKETAKTASANDVSAEDSVAKASIADENKTK